MIKRLMASYPALTVHDPKTFTVELITVLMRYPPSVSEYGITAARRNSPQFIPSIPLIEEACESYLKDQTRVTTYAKEWENRSREQLTERHELEVNGEPLEYRRKVAERILADYKSKIVPETKPQRETWKRLTNEELLAKYSPQAKPEPAQGGND